MSNAKDNSNSQPQKKRQDPLTVQSVVRAVELLESFSGVTSARSLAEVAAASGMDRSAAQRLAHTMVSLGYLERTADGLRPGRKSLDRACDYLRSSPLIERATPVIIDLRRSVGERVDLSIFDDLSMLFAVRLQSKRETFIATLIGRRVPTFCSSGGRAVLAALPDEAITEILMRSQRQRFTPKTKVQIDEIQRAITECREQGFAVAVEELLPGEVSIGAAVIEHGRPVAGIHVAASLSDWSVEDFARRAGPLVMEAAQALKR